MLGRALAVNLIAWWLAGAAPALAAVERATLVSGLSAPIAFVDPPDSLPHRLIAQQRGDILVWPGGASGPALAAPFLDLRSAGPQENLDKVLAGGERGLLSMAAHPDYAGNGFLYVFYTSEGEWDGPGGILDGDLVIERYTRDAADPERADPGSGFLILVIPHSTQGNHNGGDIRFGRDGYLYATIGDGGSSCDQAAHSGQDVDQLLGKMLRLDVDGADAYLADAHRNYAIPATNPLVGSTGADEIWALGLRNPFRFTFDADGDAYIGDVGQDDWEELNMLPLGGVAPGSPVNFGWPCREGFDPSGCANPPQGCGPASSYTEPVRVEPNTPWRAIIAGFLYRGTQAAADLGGELVYGDALHDQVWSATPDDPPAAAPGWAATQLLDDAFPYAFGEDHAGELYVLSNLGEVACIQPVGDDCTDWASDSDGLVAFGDGFESGTDDAWGLTTP